MSTHANVDCNAMHGYPPGNFHPDSGYLFVADPHAAETDFSLGVDPDRLECENDDLLKGGNVPVEVFTVVIKLEDGVGHYLRTRWWSGS